MSATPLELTNPTRPPTRPRTERQRAAMAHIRAWNRHRPRIERAKTRCMRGGELRACVRSGKVYPHVVALSRIWRSSVADRIGGIIATLTLWGRTGALLTLEEWAQVLYVCERTVRRALVELEDLGWVHVRRRFPRERGRSQAASLVEPGPALLALLGVHPPDPDPSLSIYPDISRVDTPAPPVDVPEIDTPELAAFPTVGAALPTPEFSSDPTAATAAAAETPLGGAAVGSAGLRDHRRLAASLSAAEPEALKGRTDRRAEGAGGPATHADVQAMVAGFLARHDRCGPAASSGPSSPPRARHRRGAA